MVLKPGIGTEFARQQAHCQRPAIDAGKVELLTDENQYRTIVQHIDLVLDCHAVWHFGKNGRRVRDNLCSTHRREFCLLATRVSSVSATSSRLFSRIVTPVELVEVDILRVQTP